MRRYEDFSVVTRDSQIYTLRTLGLKYDTKVFDRMINNYVHLDLYPDVRQTVADLKDYKLAILSNGSTTVLTTLVRNTGLDNILDATIGIDSNRSSSRALRPTLWSRRTSGKLYPKSISGQRG